MVYVDPYWDRFTWQPIETAPKDRAVLVYGPALDPQGVKFTSNVRTAIPSGNEWIGHGDYFRLIPTHWMEIPEPPTTQEA